MFFSSLIIRLTVFTTLIFLWYFGLFIVAVPLSIWYLYNFKAYELVALGVLIDLYFMMTWGLPVYTLLSLGSFIVMELLKPRLRKQQLV